MGVAAVRGWRCLAIGFGVAVSFRELSDLNGEHGIEFAKGDVEGSLVLPTAVGLSRARAGGS